MTDALVALLGVGVIDPAEPVAAADDLALTRGDGCFEGCRVITDASGTNSVDKLEAHLARFRRSAHALEIALDEPLWRELIDTALDAWTIPGEAAMKLVLTRGRIGTDRPLGFLTIEPISAQSLADRRDGIRVITLNRGIARDAFNHAPWLLGGIKTLSYAVNMAALREAVRRGANDVIFISTDGYVLEAPTASVVWSTGRTLFTTPTGPSGILAGTTQARLFERAAAAGWLTKSQPSRVAELHCAEGLWLASSVRGPVDVVELDGKLRPAKPEISHEIRRLAGF